MRWHKIIWHAWKEMKMKIVYSIQPNTQPMISASILLRRRKHPLPFKVLLAGLRVKLKWNRLTGEKKCWITSLQGIHRHEIPKTGKMSIYVIILNKGDRGLGLQRKKEAIHKTMKEQMFSKCFLGHTKTMGHRNLSDFATVLPVYHPEFIL